MDSRNKFSIPPTSLINVDTENQQYNSTGIILASEIKPKDILEALVEAGQNPPVSTRDAIAATIAELLIAEREVEKHPLVIPISLLIERTLKPPSIETTPPDSILGLIKAIVETENSRQKANLGIALGDRSLTMHAGMVGSKKMGDNQLTRKYALGMGIAGYETAIKFFNTRLDSSAPASLIQTTASNFLEISEILRLLTSRYSFTNSPVGLAKYAN